jgi:hypothetical protein
LNGNQKYVTLLSKPDTVEVSKPLAFSKNEELTRTVNNSTTLDFFKK